MPLSPNFRLGRYQILSTLGAGGMGEVYLAQDTKLGRRVALKILPADVASDQKRMQRFIQEAQAASALNHPNIITIHEIEEADSTHFIATEFIDGETLRQRMSHARLTTSESLDIAIQVASALSAAHESGIVHRDIKPENIMIRRDGIIKVLDFGLAKLTELQPARVDPEAPTKAIVNTEPGTVMGTAHYMSPEQSRGLDVDARTDIWSLGVVLYEMVTGRHPFTGETTTDVLASIVKATPAPLTGYSTNAPAKLEEIVGKALEKDREERYQGVKDLLVDLRRLKKRIEFEAEAERSASPDSFSAQTVITESAPPTPSSQSLRPAPTDTAQPARTVSSAEYLVTEIKRHKFFVFAVLAIIVLAGTGFIVYKFLAAPKIVAKHFASPQNLKITRLTSSGKVADIAMSPDGKYVAYVIEDAGKRSIRLRQTATASDVEIVPPDENKIEALSFTPDGVYLYYLKYVQNLGTLYQIPALGGQPKKIVVDADSGAAVSPDGKQIAFLHESERESAIMLANADGSNQQKLTGFQNSDEFFIEGLVPSWSPDGRTIAYAAVIHEKEKTRLKLLGLDVKDGTRRLLSDRDWSVMVGIQWLPDGHLIVCANEKSETEFAPVQLWFIAPNSEPQRLTNDTNDYFRVSATAAGDSLVTLENRGVANLWVAPMNDASRATQIAPASDIWSGIAWTPDGNFIYCSKAGGEFDIWTMNADGTNQKQVSSGEGAKYWPQMTPDGRFIVFLLNRGGNTNIWRMDADGGNLKQLTNGTSEFRPNISPDGRWIVYVKIENNLQAVWKVSIDGGAPMQLTTTTAYASAVSPRDGMIAYVFNDTANLLRKVSIIPPDGGALLKSFTFPPTAMDVNRIHFTPDGRAIAFKDSRGGGANLWAISIDGGGESKPLTDFKTERIFDFAWSQDGRQLAVIRGSLIQDAVLISENR